YLCYQSGSVGRPREEGGGGRRGPWQVALRLCNTRLKHNGIYIVRCDIKNLIKRSQSFWETTKVDIGKGMLGEEVNIARVEPLGFVEIRLAPVPLALPACDIGQRFRNPAAIGKELTC